MPVSSNGSVSDGPDHPASATSDYSNRHWDLHGICRNHPFLDGNKRTAAAAALTFLEMSGIEVDADEEAFYDLVIGVAERRVSKAAVTVFLEKHARHAP